LFPKLKPSWNSARITSKEKDILFREPWDKTLEGPSSDLNILTAKGNKGHRSLPSDDVAENLLRKSFEGR